MARDRSLVGVLALVALSFAVGGVWVASQAGDGGGLFGDGADGDGGPGSGEGGGGAGTGDSGANDGTPDGAPGGTRRPRKRAYVRTAEDEARDAAREALANQVVAARGAPNAANVRQMALPGAALATPADWPGAKRTLVAAQTSAAVALTLDARPRAPFVLLGGVGGDLTDIDGVRASGWGPSSNFHSGPPGAYPALDLDAAHPTPARHGLRADYYDFLDGELTEVPDLAALPPTFTRIDAAIDFPTDESFALTFEPETFGTLWRGFLLVETAGEYEFTAGSDDGVRVRIGGKDVLEHTWLRPYEETSGTLQLDAGRHPIEVAFYENYIFASCRLFWKPPGATDRTVVPASAYEPPDDVAAADPPVLAAVHPGAGRIADEVTLTGSGFSATAALNRVTFAGVPAEIVSAEPTQLVVKVPIGASTGSVVVQVGPISSRPRPFVVDTLVGLYGEYFLIGTELTDMPAFDAMAPYFVRLDGPIDFAEDDLWQMPYDPDVFAVRWRGFLYVPEEDEYEITLGSDDGATLRLDGEDVVSLPGLHAYEEGAEVVALGQGFHPLELTYFENFGAAYCRVFWRRRGEPTRSVIPRGFFFAPDALSTRAAPEVTSFASPWVGVAGDEIVIRGAGFGTDRSIVRVAFPGDAWKRPEVVADDEIRVRIPHGAGSGDLTVHVGVRSAGAGPFLMAEPIGLRGDYFELSAGEATNAAALPALLASRTPTLTRIDTRWRYGKRADWNLPFADRPFAVRWTGTIAVETTQNLGVALQSESAAVLRIEGWDVVADTEPHTLRERYGGGRLTPGEHSIELFSLHLAGDPRLHVFLTPAGRADHLDVQPTWLRPRPPR